MLKKLTASFLTAVLSIPAVLGASAPLINVAHAAGPHYSPTLGVDKDQAQVGETLSYTYNVVNDGDTNLTSVFISGHLSNFVTLKSGSTTIVKGPNTVNNYTDNWVRDGLNLGGLKPGQSAKVTFQAVVKSGVSSGATIQTSIHTTTAELPTEVPCAAYTTVGGTFSYKPTKTVDKETATIGDTLTYTLTVKNTGDLRLHRISVRDTLPTKVTYVSGSAVANNGGGNVAVADSWLTDGVNLGDLEVGQTVTFTFKVKVANSAKDGETIQNVGHFRTIELPNEIQCAAFTKIVVKEQPKEKGFIKIFKFEDFNSNGVKDGNDKAPSVGFTFHVKGMGLDFQLTTDTNGVAMSAELPVGTYTITELHKDGWTATTDTIATVNVSAGQVTEVTFGNKQAGQVLPDTGPGLALLGLLGITPLGVAIRKLKKRI